MATHSRSGSPATNSDPNPTFEIDTGMPPTPVEKHDELEVGALQVTEHVPPAALEEHVVFPHAQVVKGAATSPCCLSKVTSTAQAQQGHGVATPFNTKTPAEFAAIAHGAAQLLSTDVPLSVFPASDQTRVSQLATMQDIANATSPATLAPLVQAAVRPVAADIVEQAMAAAIQTALNPVLDTIRDGFRTLNTRIDGLEARVATMDDRLASLSIAVFNATVRTRNVAATNSATGQGDLSALRKSVAGYGPGIPNGLAPLPGVLSQVAPAVGAVPGMFPQSTTDALRMSNSDLNTLAIFYNETFGINGDDVLAVQCAKFLRWARVG